jgi:hypothetical protein
MFLLVNSTILLSMLVCVAFTTSALTESTTCPEDWENILIEDVNNKKDKMAGLRLMCKL